MQKVKNIYIIAGPNGAGKTTASFASLPTIFHCKHFVNADEIARGISPFAPEQVSVEAGRIMLQRINELMNMGEDFAIETTLATRSYVGLVDRAHKCGYKVFLLFFFLESSQHAQKRVQQRVKNGGHDIPIDVINRRYKLGIKNLFELYFPICDYISIYDNTAAPAVLVAQKNGELIIEDSEIWDKIFSQYE